VKIVIAGGSGQVGTLLSRAFVASRDEVIVLSRSHGVNGTRVVLWDGSTDGGWMREIDGADVVINLVGRNVNCRYSAANRREIMESRIASTRAIGRAIERASRPPHTWLQASTATIYAHRFDAPNDESTGIIGGGEPDAPDTWRFSIEVARAWEAAAAEASTPQTRTVLMRSAMTMSPDRGGIFDTLLALVRFGLGGSVAGGRQFVSWIHDEDFVRSVRWLIEQRSIDGPVNIAAPGPLPYRDFMRELRDAWGASIGLPAARWMVELGTRLMRTESELVLKSRRVVPQRLLASGFEFRYAEWGLAARDLCSRWRHLQGH
jgi:uncharacterized protein